MGLAVEQAQVQELDLPELAQDMQLGLLELDMELDLEQDTLLHNQDQAIQVNLAQVLILDYQQQAIQDKLALAKLEPLMLNNQVRA